MSLSSLKPGDLQTSSAAFKPVEKTEHPPRRGTGGDKHNLPGNRCSHQPATVTYSCSEIASFLILAYTEETEIGRVRCEVVADKNGRSAELVRVSICEVESQTPTPA
ncbi:unnamed protein product [Pleuronectes platessa]|uniref:Uncharacterized protein n=1 Tax=Pleuronectes platessa TaxID=8262 RepID=A0A9N7V5L9_PLEPL|nr:unnamed protein product [Pleuronectes platessa]